MSPLSGSVLLRRLPLCLLPLVVGAGAALWLLLVAGTPVRAVVAAPDAVEFPGCGATLQACLDTAAEGGTVVVQPGTYITSLTLSRAVSLTGVNSATVILQALSGQRVLTVTGAAVDSSVVISGLTFTGGSAVGIDCPAGCGGGILITATAQPRLDYLIVTSNTAMYRGGGLYAAGSLTLSHVHFINNTCTSSFCGGGGAAVAGMATVQNAVFWRNACTQTFCFGGGLWAESDLALTNTSFISNTAVAAGGGAFVVGAANVHGGLFEHNTCTQTDCNGGGLRIANSSLVGTRFISNTSRGNGAGLIAESDTTVQGALFEGNACLNSSCIGGGLFGHGPLTLTESLFLSNASNFAGGGAGATGPMTVQGGLFQNNICHGNTCIGGGLAVNGALALDGTQFISNTALGNGGGLAVFNGAATVVNALFARNTAWAEPGQALYLLPTSADLVHLTIVGPGLSTQAAIRIVGGNVGITNSIITSHSVGISHTLGVAWESHNLFFGNITDVQGQVTPGGGSQNGDPLFQNPASDDYHLRFDSPAIDMGVDAAVTSDVDGQVRPQGGGFDAGYDEYPELNNKTYLPLVRR
jgi:hypothetical protein